MWCRSGSPPTAAAGFSVAALGCPPTGRSATALTCVIAFRFPDTAKSLCPLMRRWPGRRASRPPGVRLSGWSAAAEPALGGRGALGVDRGIVLDRARHVLREDDVGHAGVRAAVPRVGVDAQGLRGRVGRLTDDAVGALVGEHR